jgi:RNA polymerase sigma factor (sigma-70 family)
LLPLFRLPGIVTAAGRFLKKFFPMPHPADPTLVEGILRGDRAVLSALYREQLPVITRLAVSAGASPEDARDVFQDAVLVVFEKAGAPGFALTSTFSTFFYGICRNLLGNLSKKKSGREVTIPDDAKYSLDTEADAQRLMENAERHRMFYRAFRRLGNDCQTLLKMAFEHHAPEDIMALLGIAGNESYRRRKYLCKEKLVRLVQADPVYREMAERL